MPAPVTFEVFTSLSPGAAHAGPGPDDDGGEQDLEAFEKGYSAGWTDSMAAHKTAKAETVEALANAIRDARLELDTLSENMRAQLASLVGVLVTSLAVKAQSSALIEQIQTLAARTEMLENPTTIDVQCAPDMRDFVEQCLAEADLQDIHISQRADLQDTEIRLSADKIVIRSIQDEFIKEIQTVLDTYLTPGDANV